MSRTLGDKMFKLSKLALTTVLCLNAAIPMAAFAAGPKAEVMHWWTSGGESAAVAKFADAYRAAGGVWTDTAIAGGDQARSVAINRMVGGNPPTAAQFNISRQFQDVVEQGMLSNVDEIATKEAWDKTLPEPISSVIKIKGHYYAIPVNIHMPTWIWYSKAAFKKAGIEKEPATPDELFAALDKLKAAGLTALAHGGQPWQETIVFMAMLANVGGKDLYLSVIRDRDPSAMNSDAFRKVLLSFKRLHGYVDTASPGRNWNDTTTLLISGKAGIQIMGDWATGEFVAAKQVAGRDYGCIPGLGPKAPYLIQGDVFVFPKTTNPETLKAQKMLAGVFVAPAVQMEFNKLKGSIPVRSDLDASQMNLCARTGLEIMKDKSRHAGIGEVYLTPDQNGALTDVLTAYWNTNMTVEKAQKNIMSALKN
jgi:glucose/mannose transport system substrate-binding protein